MGGFLFLAESLEGDESFVEAAEKPRQAFWTVKSRAAQNFREPLAAVENFEAQSSEDRGRFSCLKIYDNSFDYSI